MKLIPLTRNQFAMVDDEDFKAVNKFKWYAKKVGDTFYAARKAGRRPKRETIYMHFLIMGIKKIDHKNRNALDNRKENLRPASPAQNMWNRPPMNGRRFKGITKNTIGITWKAQIMKGGETIRIGNFKSAVESARAYDLKAMQLFGEFAWLNFIRKE